MKEGVRAVGIAESYCTDISSIAGIVLRADRVVDGAFFTTCTVGGMDATENIAGALESLDREDLQYVFVAGIAPAWYNIIDLHVIHERVGLPVLCVTFEASSGLVSSIESAFPERERTERIETYRRQPDRESITVNGHTVYVRALGVDAETTDQVLRGFTPVGGRPEPLRVARVVARAADRWRTTSLPSGGSS